MGCGGGPPRSRGLGWDAAEERPSQVDLSVMDLLKPVEKLGAYLWAALPDDGDLVLPLVPWAGQAMVALALHDSLRQSVVVVLDGTQALERFHQDTVTLAEELQRQRGEAPAILYYPASETAAGGTSDPEIVGQRMEVLRYLSEGGTSPMIVTCVQALMQRTLSPKQLGGCLRTFSIGNEIDLDEVTRFLVDCGYAPEHEVNAKGAMSIRGGLIDVWPPAEPWPVRVELVGDSVESIRLFDPGTQRSVEKRESVTVSPCDDVPGGSPARAGLLLSHIPEETSFLWCEMDAIRESATLYEESVEESGGGATTVSFSGLRRRIGHRSGGHGIVMQAASGRGITQLDMMPVQSVALERREVFQPDMAEEARRRLLADLDERASRGQSTFLFFDTPGALEHFRERFEGDGGPALRTGILSEGFHADAFGLTIVAESDIYGRRKVLSRRYEPHTRRAKPDPNLGMRVADLTCIEPGDMVVHGEHGVGKYRGLYEISVSGQMQEVLSIEYADSAVVHVPVSQSHLLTRYVGASKKAVQLHKLGGKRWTNEKAAAERSIEDLAAALLETQARREVLKGHAFSPDVSWQHEFDGSFPYRETVDQSRAIRMIKQDMESARPMDRLVCGDAGYGKTEVAMRAAFKAVMDSKQVAVLVPTTVLAQQHFDTFMNRMAAYPVRVEMLSRFCTGAQRARIIRDLAAGTVDIVIGTHALLQEGVRFKDIGLVVIDEEQRFGVRHKEWLKGVRRLVDVLTLTATPIPRTLYMSLAGARDMSLIQTPPVERTAIQTVVTRNTDKVVREAILREMGRDGQVFYLHNRVMSIERVKSRLKRVVPEARVEIAHGRMASGTLAAVMHRFVKGEFDVLLCTTIIESGMDIPRANTILIDRADRFGIADLYQLRGRVGRSSHKGYAILMLPSHGMIDPDARRRINAVRKYSALSAGFNLALRDLEIRGSGNILGAQQSGHITAIGFGLYCQLLKRTVARLRDEEMPPVIDVDMRLDFLELSPRAEGDENAAMVPYGYIDDESLRVEIYRKLAETARRPDVESLARELADRFGPVPATVERLLKVADIRIACAERNIRNVDVRSDKVVLSRFGEYLTRGSRFPRLTGANSAERLEELLSLVESADEWSD